MRCWFGRPASPAPGKYPECMKPAFALLSRSCGDGRGRFEVARTETAMYSGDASFALGCAACPQKEKTC